MSLMPQNSDQLKTFWLILKEKYKKGWEAENLDQLHNYFDYVLRNKVMVLVHHIGNTSFTRVDAARRHDIENLD